MTHFAYDADEPEGPFYGLVVLQADESIETDFRRLLPVRAELNISRVPSGEAVSEETLQTMEGHLSRAAGLLPKARQFDVLAYACTSGSAVIGPDAVARRMRAGARARAVTDPMSALIAACGALGIGRLALLSPYVEAVSARLRARLDMAGFATPVFGSFDEAEEAKVVRIDADSITRAARALCEGGGVDGLFLSCTNLRTLDVIAPLEAGLGLPVLSSNQVLAWHMARLAGGRLADGPWGRLGAL